MITPVVQRWNSGRDSYRPAGEPIRTADYDVAAIADDATPKAFVEANHYSGTYPAARFRHGLYRAGALVGVAVFSHPCNDKVLTKCLPGRATDSVELGRFVLVDDVPANGETWFLARCFELLRREGLGGVVSFSDPHPRQAADGRCIFGGHIGTIYQAHNAVYLGRGTARSLALLPDGRALNARTIQKIRRLERGWRYSVDQLVAQGAAPMAASESPMDWLRRWLPQITRPLRHAGNLKYVWGFSKAARKGLPPSLAYPKVLAA